MGTISYRTKIVGGGSQTLQWRILRPNRWILDENGKIVERFPIILTGFDDGKARVIGIPTVENGKGSTMAETTKDAVSSVEADELIAAVGGDTQASNTGEFSGMFRKLEDLFQRRLLKVPCRHHSDNLMEKNIFQRSFRSDQVP